jgi:hypothetical protein
MQGNEQFSGPISLISNGESARVGHLQRKEVNTSIAPAEFMSRDGISAADNMFVNNTTL